MNIRDFTLINTRTGKPMRTARKTRQPRNVRPAAIVNAGSADHKLVNPANAVLFCQPVAWEQYSRDNGYSAERAMYRNRWNLD